MMNNNKFYKIGVIVSILLIAFIITCIVLASKNDNKVAETEEDFPSVMSSTNIVEEEASINTNEFGEIAVAENNSVNENVSNTQTNVNETTATQNTTNTSSLKNATSEDVTNSNATEEITNTDPVFCYPVDGEVTMEYAKDKLVYSNTLGEWITHLGIDIKAATTTVVKASADGTVKSISTDPRYGLTVVIEHTNGFSTVYSNLLTAEFVEEGEKVTQGQTIGTVGNTASFEILDESHLHFEILKDGEQIDPNMYLKD